MLLFLIFVVVFISQGSLKLQVVSGKVECTFISVHVLSAEGEQEQHRVVMRGSTRDPGGTRDLTHGSHGLGRGR